MKNRTFDKGFTLIEVCIVIVVIIVVAAIAVPSFKTYYRIHKFKDYSYSMENMIKGSKVIAMERSVNIGVCVDSTAKTVRIVDMGVSRSEICTGTTLNTLKIEDDFVTLSSTETSKDKGTYGLAFDPRGFSIYLGGNVCVSDGVKHYKVVVSGFGGAMRIDKGSGGCSS